MEELSSGPTSKTVPLLLQAGEEGAGAASNKDSEVSV